MSKNAILEINGNKYELPIIVGSENETAIDISKLLAQGKAVPESTHWLVHSVKIYVIKKYSYLNKVLYGGDNHETKSNESN